MRVLLIQLVIRLISASIIVAEDAEKTSMTCFHIRGGIIWCPKSLKDSIEQWATLIDDAADETHSKITTEFFQIEKAGLSTLRSSISNPKKGSNHLPTNRPLSQNSHPENSGPLTCATHKENSDNPNFGVDLPEPLELRSNKDDELQDQQLQVRDPKVRRQTPSPRVWAYGPSPSSGPSPTSSSSSSSSPGSSSRSSSSLCSSSRSSLSLGSSSRSSSSLGSSSRSSSSPGSFSGSSSNSSGSYSVVKNTRRKRPLVGIKRQKSMTARVRNLVSGIRRGSAWLLRKTPLQSLARTLDTSAPRSKNNVSRQDQPPERAASLPDAAETSPDLSGSLSPSPQQSPRPHPSPQAQKARKPRVTLTESMKARIFRLAVTLFPSLSRPTRDDLAKVKDDPVEDDDDAQSHVTDSSDDVHGAPYDWELSASEHLKPHNNKVVKRKEGKNMLVDDDTPRMPVTGWSRKPLNAQDLAARLRPLEQLQTAGYELRPPPRKYKYDYLDDLKG